MDATLLGAFVNLGATGLMLWWLTQSLVPQLQKERNEARGAFQTCQEKERTLHRESIDKVMLSQQQTMDRLFEHIQIDHVEKATG